MKKLIIPVLLLIVVVLSGCGGPGQASLKYSWVSVPQYLYDENPSTPATIYNDQYFPTEPDTFYMEYVAWDGSAWWMIYTIEVDTGVLFSAGADWYFEIALYSSGPSFYNWYDWEKSIAAGVSLPPEDSEINEIESSTDGPLGTPSDDYEVIIDERVGCSLIVQYGEMDL
jgi:hypothetical protein